MSIRAIPRSAIGGSIRAARLPLDIAVGLLPGNGDGPSASATVALDRVEAHLRDLAGIALADEALREDAALRRLAADERERALRLRAAAARRAQVADERLDETLEETEEQREQAAERARRQREQAAAQRKQRSQQAAQTAGERKASSTRAAAAREEVIEEQATDARLEQLEREAAALDETAAALATESEAGSPRRRGTRPARA
jgi:flagellar biosynthesis GTPase FlhF